MRKRCFAKFPRQARRPLRPAPAAAKRTFSPGRNGCARWASDNESGIVAAEELPYSAIVLTIE